MFAIFLILHLATAISGLFGIASYDGTLSLLRRLYRPHLLVELTVIGLSGTVHLACAVLQMLRRRKVFALKGPWWMRAHRLSGYFLLAVSYTHLDVYKRQVLFCEAARKLLLTQGGGTLCVFSSVAGDRARKPVVLYGASKAGLSAYLNGLDHKYYSSGLRVICVRPGFVKTGMAAGLRPPPFSGEPEQVAREVRAALLCPRPVVYTPIVWELVMTAISMLPRAVMRRINF